MYCFRSTRTAGSLARAWIWARSASRCTQSTTSPACSSCGPRRARSSATGSDSFVRKDKSYRQPSVSAGIIHATVALTSGTKLGPYEIVAPLGAGGMGEVYRARDSKLGREVALKLLPPLFTADADRVARFKREAQLLASLNHPHIGAIYGFED